MWVWLRRGNWKYRQKTLKKPENRKMKTKKTRRFDGKIHLSFCPLWLRIYSEKGAKRQKQEK